ncbi:unnamed protein product [Pelagomonas calceolata]|uniref:Uncharacterized protein n=1 Tax=Pelagomonas calceolata TaxID=35677 RepID=A0A8J2SLM2_9STRA|nr:unnamed protein product [Pelagomonas calceolata]|mmetsp:Transcript_23341/g.65422  ORF Transcript_23341/g.65422 Transcript_23341/m.65422 type:complete len:204 (-) Transcript_23341:153-764(-)
MTYAATSPISSSERRPPNAGMAFLPFVTWVTTDDSLRPPAKYLSSASLRRVFSAAMTLLPPAWHAAQLPANSVSPDSMSPAKAAKGARSAPAASVAAATSLWASSLTDAACCAWGAKATAGAARSAMESFMAICACAGRSGQLPLRGQNYGKRRRAVRTRRTDFGGHFGPRAARGRPRRLNRCSAAARRRPGRRFRPLKEAAL